VNHIGAQNLQIPVLVCTVAFAALAQTAPPAQTNRPNTAAFHPRLISISVANLEETISWYRDILGFSIIQKMDLPKYSLKIAFMEYSGFQIELIEFKNSVSYEAIQKQFPGVDDRAKIQGLGKFGFVADDLEGLAAKLKSKRVHFFRDVTHDQNTGDTYFIISDNSGNWIQFFAPR